MAPPGDARIVLIAAVGRGRVIGARGALPWRLPEDLRRFKQVTMGHPMVMGRKTFASLGRALPGRTSIVVTRQPGFAAPEGVLVARSPEEGLRLAARASPTVFVIGGAELYAATLPHATEILATLVDAAPEGDAHFPALDSAWHVEALEAGAPEVSLRHAFVTLVRRGGPDACALCRVRAGEAPGGWDARLLDVLRDLTGAPPARAPGPPR